MFGRMGKTAWLFPTTLCFKFRFLNINTFLKLYTNKEGNQLSCSKYIVLPWGTWYLVCFMSLIPCPLQYSCLVPVIPLEKIPVQYYYDMIRIVTTEISLVFRNEK